MKTALVVVLLVPITAACCFIVAHVIDAIAKYFREDV